LPDAALHFSAKRPGGLPLDGDLAAGSKPCVRASSPPGKPEPTRQSQIFSCLPHTGWRVTPCNWRIFSTATPLWLGTPWGIESFISVSSGATQGSGQVFGRRSSTCNRHLAIPVLHFVRQAPAGLRRGREGADTLACLSAIQPGPPENLNAACRSNRYVPVQSIGRARGPDAKEEVP
jgi:hypothetical protein